MLKLNAKFTNIYEEHNSEVKVTIEKAPDNNTIHRDTNVGKIDKNKSSINTILNNILFGERIRKS